MTGKRPPNKSPDSPAEPSTLLGLFDARGGDAEAGRFLMREFAAMLRIGIQPQEAEILADMLDKIGDGMDADEALLVRQRGAPSKHERDRWIWKRVNEVRGDHSSLEAAYRAVSKELDQWPEDAAGWKRVKAIHLQRDAVLNPEKQAKRRAEAAELIAHFSEPAPKK